MTETNAAQESAVPKVTARLTHPSAKVPLVGTSAGCGDGAGEGLFDGGEEVGETWEDGVGDNGSGFGDGDGEGTAGAGAGTGVGMWDGGDVGLAVGETVGTAVGAILAVHEVAKIAIRSIKNFIIVEKPLCYVVFLCFVFRVIAIVWRTYEDM